MPYQAANEYNTEHGHNAHNAATSLFAVLGQARHMGGGVGGFMGKTIVTAASTSVVFGLAGFMLGSCVGAPLLGYIGGLQLGFTGGLVTRWAADRDAAIRAVEDYPALMAHHLALLEPYAFRRAGLGTWAADLRVNLAKQGTAVAAYYSAMDAIARLNDEREERLVGAILEQQPLAPGVEDG